MLSFRSTDDIVNMVRRQFVARGGDEFLSNLLAADDRHVCQRRRAVNPFRSAPCCWVPPGLDAQPRPTSGAARRHAVVDGCNWRRRRDADLITAVEYEQPQLHCPDDRRAAPSAEGTKLPTLQPSPGGGVHREAPCQLTDGTGSRAPLAYPPALVGAGHRRPPGRGRPSRRTDGRLLRSIPWTGRCRS